MKLETADSLKAKQHSLRFSEKPSLNWQRHYHALNQHHHTYIVPDRSENERIRREGNYYELHSSSLQALTETNRISAPRGTATKVGFKHVNEFRRCYCYCRCWWWPLLRKRIRGGSDSDGGSTSSSSGSLKSRPTLEYRRDFEVLTSNVSQRSTGSL